MTFSTPGNVLDEILALQLTVAWAGEGACKPRRLGWWKTDLVDPDGGGDLLKRLMPETHQWASLEAVREAAIRADGKSRSRMADPDKMRTLFFMGFDLDEQLAERLAHHKRSRKPLKATLDLKIDVGAAFDREKTELAMSGIRAAEFTVVPLGRQLPGMMPQMPDQAARDLFSALAPLTDTYPMPFYGVK